MATQLSEFDIAGDGGGFPVEAAVRQALRCRDFVSFVDWLAQEMVQGRAGPIAAMMRTDPAATRALAMTLGRTLWNATPRPDNDFRPLTIPKPDRNAPCPCGSGQKYKRCCGMLDLPPFDMEDLSVLGTVLDTVPREAWAKIPFRKLSPEEVAFTAGEWREDNRLEDAALLLECLFAAVPKPDERFESAFDTLMDAYLDLDRTEDRAQLIERMVAGSNQRLRSAALHRRCTIHADRGEWNDAWRSFAEAQRQEPDNPSLSHLEVLMLASQGRVEEAGRRAHFWATHWARKGDEYASLVETLRAFAEDPERIFARAGGAGDDFDDLDEAEESWELDALGDILEELADPEMHYRLDPEENLAGPLRPDKALEKLEKGWRKVFEGGDPSSMSLSEQDESDAWLNPDAWIDWLADHPHAFDSFKVLDDLVAALDVYPSDDVDVDDLTRTLLERAERLLRQTLAANAAEGKNLEWGFPENHSALRLIGRLANDMELENDAESTALLEWIVLELDPDDPQELRDSLARRYLTEGRHAEALALCERFKVDSAGLSHARVLALHGLGRLSEAEAALDAARRKWPRVFEALMSPAPNIPEGIDLSQVEAGSEDEAWLYSLNWLPFWTSSGALDWAKGLGKPS